MDPTTYLINDGYCIFLFHGVVETDSDGPRNYTRKHLPSEVFREIIDRLQNTGTAISMDEIVEAKHCNKPLPPRSFAISFDDGFENNYSIATPILREFNIPATFYVTTGFIHYNWNSWIDRVENCIADRENVILNLPWAKAPVMANSVDEKIALLDQIRNKVKFDRSLNEIEFADDVEQQMNENVSCKPEVTGPLYQKMAWSQVAELAADPLFTIGGHSHTHSTLSFLNKSDLDAEIEKSMELIDKNINLKCVHYSYPEGHVDSYSDLVIETLRHHGIKCCPTAIEGVNKASQDLFELRRIAVT